MPSIVSRGRVSDDGSHQECHQRHRLPSLLLLLIAVNISRWVALSYMFRTRVAFDLGLLLGGESKSKKGEKTRE